MHHGLAVADRLLRRSNSRPGTYTITSSTSHGPPEAATISRRSNTTSLGEDARMSLTTPSYANWVFIS